MLKKSASIVLASWKSSTYHKGTPRSFTSLRPCWTAILSILTNMYKKYVVNIQESIEYW